MQGVDANSPRVLSSSATGPSCDAKADYPPPSSVCQAPGRPDPVSRSPDVAKRPRCCAFRSCHRPVRDLLTAFRNYGRVLGRRGTRSAKREEGESRVYRTVEQRRVPECIGGRMRP